LIQIQVDLDSSLSANGQIDIKSQINILSSHFEVI